MSAFDYSFEAPIGVRDFGKINYTVIYLPEHLEKELPFGKYNSLRIDGEVADTPISGAWNPSKKGHYLILSKSFLKTAAIAYGDFVEVRFSIVDPDMIDIPDELFEALTFSPKAKAAWDRLTAGKRRGYAYLVAKAKRPETKEKRIIEIFDEIS